TVCRHLTLFSPFKLYSLHPSTPSTPLFAVSLLLLLSTNTLLVFAFTSATARPHFFLLFHSFGLSYIHTQLAHKTTRTRETTTQGTISTKCEQLSERGVSQSQTQKKKNNTI